MIELIIVLVVLGVLLWFITHYVPMDPMFRNLIYVVAVVLVLIWLLRALGGGGLDFDL